jgi:hypothetical protein
MGIWTWEREGERDGRILNDEERRGSERLAKWTAAWNSTSCD